MAGLDKNTPQPTEIKLHQKSRVMEITFGMNFYACIHPLQRCVDTVTDRKYCKWAN
jgi:hypothetical protein